MATPPRYLMVITEMGSRGAMTPFSACRKLSGIVSIDLCKFWPSTHKTPQYKEGRPDHTHIVFSSCPCGGEAAIDLVRLFVAFIIGLCFDLMAEPVSKHKCLWYEYTSLWWHGPGGSGIMRRGVSAVDKIGHLCYKRSRDGGHEICLAHDSWCRRCKFYDIGSIDRC